MRYRSTGTFTGQQVTYSDLNNGNANNDSIVTHTTFSSWDSAGVGNTNETWDTVTPNFYKRIRAGEVIVNPFKNVKISAYDSGNGIHSRSNTVNGDGSVFTQIRDGPQLSYMMQASRLSLQCKDLISAAEYGNALALAATRARSKSLETVADGLVTVYELQKTLRTFTRPLENVSRLLSTFKRSRSFGQRSRALKDYFSSEWLKFRYGVMPTLYDIDNIKEALSKDIQRGRSRSNGIEKLYSEKTEPSAIWSHGDIDTTYQDFFTDSMTVKAGLIYDSKLVTKDYLGLNLRSVPSAVWEIIPFSFVVDWFLNVQHYVRALSAELVLNTLGGYVVIEREQSAHRTILGSVIARNVGASTLLRQCSGSRHLVKRTKTRLVGCPSPSLVSKNTLSKINLNDKRILDAFALISQQLRRI